MEEVAQGPVRETQASPTHPACASCGLFRAAPPGAAFTYGFMDPREGAEAKPRVMFIVPGWAGDYVQRGVSPGVDLFLAALEDLECSWVVIGTTRCGRSEDARGKLAPEVHKNCSGAFLHQDLLRWSPAAIACLGLESVKALLGRSAPKSIGGVARKTLRLEDIGLPIVVSRSPWAHRPYDGPANDVVDEWDEAFGRLQDEAFGRKRVFSFKYTEIGDYQQAMSWARAHPRQFTFDTETDFHELDAKRRTPYHPEARLLCFSTAYKDSNGDRNGTTIIPPAALRPEVWESLFAGARVQAHFAKVDLQVPFATRGIELFQHLARLPTGEVDVRDPGTDLHLCNMSLPGNGLLPLVLKYRPGVPNWKTPIKNAVDRRNQELGMMQGRRRDALSRAKRREEWEAKARSDNSVIARRAQKWLAHPKNEPVPIPPEPPQPPGSAGYDASIPQLYPYCAEDSVHTDWLGDEVVPVQQEQTGGRDPILTRLMARVLELTAKVERVGLPTDPARLAAAERVFRKRLLEGKRLLLAHHPAMVKATMRNKDFRKAIKRGEDPATAALQYCNPLSSAFRLALCQEMGYDLSTFPRTRNGKGKGPSTDKNVIKTLSGDGKKWAELDPTQRFWKNFAMVKSVADLETKLPTFRWVCPDGRIRTEYRTVKVERGTGEGSEGSGGTDSGRLSCIAQGTPVEMPRDLRAYPHGIPIEDVRVGDEVYSYDDHGNLSIRKVLGSAMTGIRETVRLRWRGQGRKSSGELLLTPEHRVRRLDGTWVRADGLVPGDRIMALSRGVGPYGYPRLYAAGGLEVREHTFIADQKGWDRTGKHVHHRNECKLDNRPENLEPLTPLEHVRSHLPDEETLRQRARYMHTPEARAANKAAARKGEDHHFFRPVSRFTLLRRLAQCAGGPKKVAQRHGLDYSTVIRQCRDHGVDFRQLSRRYDGQGTYLSRGRVRSALGRQYRNTNDIQKNLRVGYYRVRELAEFYGLAPMNHEVVSVTPGPVTPVYDLTIEGTECFVAGELAVHNSRNPNLQNLKKDPAFRALFVAPPGWIFLEGDYDQGEPRVLAWLADCPGWKVVFQRGLDVYQVFANATYKLGVNFDLPDAELRAELERVAPKAGTLRNSMKPILLAVMYMKGVKSFSRDTGLPMAEAQKVMDDFFAAFPEIRQFQQHTWEIMHERRFVTTPFTRRQLPPWPNPKDDRYDEKVAELHRHLCNFPIQATLSDICCWLGWEFMRELEHAGWWGKRAEICNSAHDALWSLVRIEDVPEYGRWKVRVMEDRSRLPFDFPVPLTVSLKGGTDLSKLYDLDKHNPVWPPAKEKKAA